MLLPRFGTVEIPPELDKWASFSEDSRFKGSVCVCLT